MNILHIMKEPDDAYAWQTAETQRSHEGDRVTVLLLQDAIFSGNRGSDRVFACRDDVLARGARTEASLVGYPEIVNLILESDSIVCW
jgi:sulfur transfer complex TusBCD TusB component (DsrH family)